MLGSLPLKWTKFEFELYEKTRNDIIGRRNLKNYGMRWTLACAHSKFRHHHSRLIPHHSSRTHRSFCPMRSARFSRTDAHAQHTTTRPHHTPYTRTAPLALASHRLFYGESNAHLTRALHSAVLETKCCLFWFNFNDGGNRAKSTVG